MLEKLLSAIRLEEILRMPSQFGLVFVVGLVAGWALTEKRFEDTSQAASERLSLCEDRIKDCEIDLGKLQNTDSTSVSSRSHLGDSVVESGQRHLSSVQRERLIAKLSGIPPQRILVTHVIDKEARAYAAELRNFLRWELHWNEVFRREIPKWERQGTLLVFRENPASETAAGEFADALLDADVDFDHEINLGQSFWLNIVVGWNPYLEPGGPKAESIANTGRGVQTRSVRRLGENQMRILRAEMSTATPGRFRVVYADTDESQSFALDFIRVFDSLGWSTEFAYDKHIVGNSKLPPVGLIELIGREGVSADFRTALQKAGVEFADAYRQDGDYWAEADKAHELMNVIELRIGANQ